MTVHELSLEKTAAPPHRGGARSGEPVPARPPKGRSRAAMFLILPTMILLGIVVLYPVVSAMVMSLFKDPTIDPATGKFVDQGFAGLSNYTHWLFQQCTDTTGASVSCPGGTLGSLFWQSVWVTVFFTVVTVAIEVALGLWFATIMNRAFRGRALLRTSILVRGPSRPPSPRSCGTSSSRTTASPTSCSARRSCGPVTRGLPGSPS